MYILNQNIEFPDVANADHEGLLAIGGDLSVERLLLAYKNGIFPWFNEGDPYMWWSPDPRFVLYPEKLKVSKSMKQILRKSDFTVTVNKNFLAVIEACSQAKRNGQSGTWITKNMVQSYLQLHTLGYAKSIEVWQNNILVAGLYGIDLKNGVFCGESMFTNVSNASKVGFITFLQNTKYKLIDCQIFTNHLASLGAEEITRKKFLSYLK
ncbi:MAG: leucyl/phenylalanyl-tRNA--protein transferase [Oceanihabitans sp.]